MRTSEIRTRWLDYFASKDHHIVPSVPLVSPDPSILFTIAGMVPFIPYILGTEPAPWPRAASVQKCIRTNDIEEVGHTTRHGTFFQMAGNFSFGDYFKEGAIDYAWELLTGPQETGGYGLDGDRLWVTVWDEDEVAFDHWTRVIGLDPVKVQKLPRAEIFWDTGQPGPAGPCAEIHYDRGPAYGPDGGPAVDLKGDRFLEIWNLVFDEFLRGEGSGKDYPLLGRLEHTAIDTGLGVERLAFLLQGRENMYEIDEVFPVILAAQEMSGRRYAEGANSQAPDDVRMRVVADHVRSALMLIGDGVRPGNDGRGYVLRRLIRRSVRAMRLLGVDEPAMPTLLTASKGAMAPSYPELEANWDTISQVAYAEEEAFRRTLVAGTTILDTAVARAKADAADSSQGAPVLGGAEAFALHDTYGFPIDLTLEMAAEQGVRVDEKGFRALMQEQKDRARADAMSKKTGLVDASHYTALLEKAGGHVPFLGYTQTAAEARVIGILVDGQPVPSATAPADIEVVLDRTPFWAEQGGQLADTGEIRAEGGAILEVVDVQAPVKGLPIHRGHLTEGQLTLDDAVHAAIDVERRTGIARAHTATHMVHKVIHENLGEQATQAGSENSPSRLRFDFRHGRQVPSSVMADIEGRVNERLQDDLEVTDEVMDIDAARAAGAMALFGEKYGRQVRVVSIGGDWSKELCAGTHVPRTGTLGTVTILGEASIGSGVRRVDALVGAGAYAQQAKERAILSQVTALVGGRAEDMPERIGALMTRLKAAEKELAGAQRAKLLEAAAVIAAGAQPRPVPGGGFVKAVLYDAGQVADAADLRTLALDVRGRLGEADPVVVAVFGRTGGRPSVVVATNAAAREQGRKAGAFVRAAAKVLGGGGGGKDDVAQGGGQDESAIGAALAELERMIESTGR